MRVLFDTNVVLDVLLERELLVQESTLLVEAVKRGALGGLLCATTLTTVSYVVERERDRSVATDGVRWLLQLFEVAPVSRPELEGALTNGFADYEDGVLHEAARSAGADAVVTRNAADFAAATLPVYTPSALLAALAA